MKTITEYLQKGHIVQHTSEPEPSKIIEKSSIKEGMYFKMIYRTGEVFISKCVKIKGNYWHEVTFRDPAEKSVPNVLYSMFSEYTFPGSHAETLNNQDYMFLLDTIEQYVIDKNICTHQIIGNIQNNEFIHKQ